jgi:hypothetical protein
MMGRKPFRRMGHMSIDRKRPGADHVTAGLQEPGQHDIRDRPARRADGSIRPCLLAGRHLLVRWHAVRPELHPWARPDHRRVSACARSEERRALGDARPQRFVARCSRRRAATLGAVMMKAADVVSKSI